MEVLISIFLFILGTIFASFFCVVGERLPEGLSIVKPNSYCTNCNHKLKWYELIPILSYIIQKGKCRKCGIKIPWIYPIIELTTGILFVTSYIIFNTSVELIISLIIISFLIIVFVCDVTYLIIPDEVTLFFCVLMFTYKLITYGIKVAAASLLSGLGLFILMYLIMLLGNFIFKKESLGGGDVKLMFFVGITLGIISGSFAIFLSSLIALPISIIFYLKDKNNVIPFGPFILMAVFIIYLFQIDISTIFTII